MIVTRPGCVRLYDATRGMASRYLRHFCATCLREWRAAGWSVRAGMWTAEDSERANCYGCANPGAAGPDRAKKEKRT